MSLSLVPYRDSNDVVLRHERSVVVRDPHSKQLILRQDSDVHSTTPSLSDCPLCHQKIPPQSPAQDGRHPSRKDSFVSPEYFRMLRASSDFAHNPPSSPVRRLVQPAYPFPSGPFDESGGEAEFLGSGPAPTTGPGIREEAFSPNYYKKFFTEEKELGKGGKGVVYLVKHVLDGVSLGHFACKRVPVGNDHAWLEKVLIEVQLLQSLSHPNLVSYRHVWLEDYQPNRFGPTLPCAFILQQYCNSGDLLRYVAGETPVVMSAKEQMRERRKSKNSGERPDMKSNQRKLKLDEIYSFFKDITSGLAHLHASNYIHRDLKPSNCLLNRVDNDLCCLISDFGEVQSESAMRNSTGATGTISYCAPEVLARDATGRYGEFSTKSDVFSLGMILYFMCFGRLPYSCADAIQEEMEDLDSLRAEIGLWAGFHDERRERPDLPAQLYEFLKRLLALDPMERPSAAEILQAISSGSNLATPTRSGRINKADHETTLRMNKRTRNIECSTSGDSEDSEKLRIIPDPSSEEGNHNRTRGLENGNVYVDNDSRKEGSSCDDQPRSMSQRLLLPPPSSTRLNSPSQIRRTLWDHLKATLGLPDRITWILAIKWTICVFKLSTLVTACQPRPFRNSVPIVMLILLSTIDLAEKERFHWKLTAVFLLIHFAVLYMAKQGDYLCLPQQSSLMES